MPQAILKFKKVSDIVIVIVIAGHCYRYHSRILVDKKASDFVLS